MREGNILLRKWKKILGFCFFVVFAAMVYFPQQTQAAVTKTTTQAGFRLSGSARVNVEDSETYRYYLNYSIPSVKDGKMQYTIDATITFATADPQMIPDTVDMSLGLEQFSLHPNGAFSCRLQKTFSAEFDFSTFELNFDYGGTNPSEEYLDFNLDVSVEENRKSPEVTIDPPSTPSRYEKTSEYYMVTVNDPYTRDPLKNGKYSVEISDPSVAKISNIQDIGTNVDGGSRLNISVYYLKSGSAELIFKYQGITARSKFTIQKTSYIIPDSFTLRVGETPSLASYIGVAGGGGLSVKNIKSSNKSVVGVSGKLLVAKKTGRAKITATINGKKRSILVTVVKKPAKKPTLKQLKVSSKGYTYYQNTGKMYLKFSFKNTSSRTITKVRLRYGIPLDEYVSRTKNFSVTIKPKKTVTKRFYVGKLVSPPDGKISVKCLKFWYR